MIPNPNAPQQIMEYIQRTRGTYTRDAITAQLLAAGHTAAQIEEAWRVVEAGPMPPSWAGATPPESPATPPLVRLGIFWLTLLGFIIGSYLVGGGLGYASVASSGTLSSVLGLLGTGLYAVIQLAGLIGGILLLSRNRPVAIALLIGILMTNIVLPFILVIGILGICVFALSTYNTSP